MKSIEFIEKNIYYKTEEDEGMAKSTDELMKILKSESNIEHFIEENTEDIIRGDLKNYIVSLLQEKKLTIAKVSRRGQMSDSYLYKLHQDVFVLRRNFRQLYSFQYYSNDDFHVPLEMKLQLQYMNNFL